jgi:ribonuclease D
MVISKEQQASDWLKRPLSKEQILYAFLDSELVYELYFHIKKKDF